MNGSVGISISGTPKEAVEEMRAAINDILNAPVDNKTMRVALKSLTMLGMAPNQTTISNCCIQQDRIQQDRVPEPKIDFDDPEAP